MLERDPNPAHWLFEDSTYGEGVAARSFVLAAMRPGATPRSLLAHRYLTRAPSEKIRAIAKRVILRMVEQAARWVTAVTIKPVVMLGGLGGTAAAPLTFWLKLSMNLSYEQHDRKYPLDSLAYKQITLPMHWASFAVLVGLVDALDHLERIGIASSLFPGNLL
ncbi:hypothetical protein BC828DRAFT_402114 [Blastocladiella britannica]|nr:hypothetical protein BC828DRAFT_402114 [Blastocladiella britannica]